MDCEVNSGDEECREVEGEKKLEKLRKYLGYK